MSENTLKRNIFQRIFGIPATKAPADPGCWEISDNQITIQLDRAPELSQPWGAIHIDGESMPQKILVFQDGNGEFRAFRNKCEHGGRKLDPVPGAETVQCCSVGQSLFDYEGNVISGSAEKPVKVYPVDVENGSLIITLE